MGIFRQFPYSNFHDMNMDELIKIMRQMQDEWETTKSEWASYKEFIDNYFANLDVSAEVLNALRTMVTTGEFNTVVDPVIITEVTRWLAANITQPTDPAIDSSLTIHGAAADAKAAGDQINSNTYNLSLYNVVSLIDPYTNRTSGTHNGITYNWTGRHCDISGTSVGVSVNTIFARRAIRGILSPGSVYFVRYKTTDIRIGLNFVFYDSDNNSTYINITGNSKIKVPDSAVEMLIRLYIPSGITVDAASVEQSVLNHRPYTESLTGGKNEIYNYPACLTFFALADLYDSSNRATPADIPLNSYCMTNGSRLTGWHKDIADNINYTIICYGNMQYTNARRYIIIPTDMPGILFASSSDSGNTLTYWTQRLTVPKILLLGSSFGQDCSEYAPFIMENMNPDLSVVFGIAYSSGAGISDYLSYFNDNTPVTYYKRNFGSQAWTSGAQKTVKQVLTDDRWDIILINQSAAEQGVLSSYNRINDYLWAISSYITHNVKIGFVMAQNAIGYPAYDYSDIIDCINAVLPSSFTAFMIPAGTAIENARHTRLDTEVGDAQHLAYDTTGHLQEGLPVYIANLVTASKLCEILTGSAGAITGDPTVPDSSYIALHNIPGQNGTPTGVSADNILLGQRCALLAIKSPESTLL